MLSASGSAESAPMRRASSAHCVGQIGPGAVVEDLGRGERRVVVDDVDSASGDRLQMRVVRDRGGHGGAQHLEGGDVLAAQPRCEP